MGLTSPNVSPIVRDMTQTTTPQTAADRISTARGAELGTYHILVDGRIAATVKGAAKLGATLRSLTAQLIQQGA